MSEKMAIYKADSNARETINKRMNIMLVVMTATFILIASSVTTKFNLFEMNKFTIFVIGFLLLNTLVWVLTSKSVMKSILNRELKIFDDGLECSLGKTSKMFKFSDIKGVKVHKNKQGVVMTIDLKSSNDRLIFHHFERMDEIFEKIKARVSSDVLKEKSHAVSLEKPQVFFLFMLGLMLVFFPLHEFMKNFLSKESCDTILGLFDIVFGVSLTFFKIISRLYVDKKWRIFEIVFGLCLILFGIQKIFVSIF